MITLDRHRLRFTAQLQPALGSAFQPTGFPDIGAAKFDRFDENGDTQEALLVESVQSMANRLEATTWDPATNQPVELLRGLPYVRVHRQSAPEEFLTSSRLEAHRLASAFVRDSELDGHKMLQVIRDRLGLAKDTPLNHPRMAQAMLRLDPFCLLHGVFFSHKEWLGQPRFPRAVSAVIEAYDVKQVVSGGRKSDIVRHQLDKNGQGGGTSEGYGSIPFHRVEWTAREIKAMFSVDVELIRSYGLGNDLTELLVGIALWEIRSLLSRGLRLRTACDLDLIGDGPADLPHLAELSDRLTKLIGSLGEVFGDGEPITVLWKG